MKNREKVIKAVDALYELIKQNTDDHCVSVSLLFTSEGYVFDERILELGKIGDELYEHINLRGEVIK